MGFLMSSSPKTHQRQSPATMRGGTCRFYRFFQVILQELKRLGQFLVIAIFRSTTLKNMSCFFISSKTKNHVLVVTAFGKSIFHLRTFIQKITLLLQDVAQKSHNSLEKTSDKPQVDHQNSNNANWDWAVLECRI